MEPNIVSRTGLAILLIISMCGQSWASHPKDTKKRDYVTDIDYTHKTPYSIDAIGSVEHLRLFEKDIKHEDYIYGKYSQPLAMTSGVNIEIYPNGKFAVTEWCDVCGLPATLYLGSWHEQDDVVTFSVEQTNPGKYAESWRKEFTRQYGPIGNFNFFVVEKGLAIGKSILVPQDAMMTAPIDRYFVRVRPYVNWEKNYSEAKHGLDKFKSDE